MKSTTSNPSAVAWTAAPHQATHCPGRERERPDDQRVRAHGHSSEALAGRVDRSASCRGPTREGQRDLHRRRRVRAHLVKIVFDTNVVVALSVGSKALLKASALQVLSEMSPGECAARTRLQVSLECQCPTLVGELDHTVEDPRDSARCVLAPPGVVSSETFTGTASDTRVVASGIAPAPDDVDIPPRPAHDVRHGCKSCAVSHDHESRVQSERDGDNRYGESER